MSGRSVGDPGASGLDRPSFYPISPPAQSSVAATAQTQLAFHDSNVDVQNHPPSGQDPKARKAALERAFARLNLNSAVVPHQSGTSNTDLYVSKQPRSPEKAGAPPFQYRALPRPAGYHIASSGQVPSSSPPTTASFTQEAGPSSHTAQHISSSKPSPLLPSQGPSAQSFAKNRVAPPRPPRSPTVYDFSQFDFQYLRSTSAPSVKLFCQGPLVEPFENSSPLSVTQVPTGRPLLFDESSTSPQLIPPHEPGGYNPLLNPYNPKAKSSSPKPTKKPGILERAKRKFSRRRVSSHPSASPATPIRRSPTGSTVTTPFPRPRAPTPNRGLGISQPQEDLSGQKFSEPFGCKTSEVAPTLNKVTDIKTLFSVTDEGATLPHIDPAENWEIEALRKKGVLTKRVFDCPDFRFENFGEHRAPFNQYQSNLQDSAGISAPKLDNSRESQDSSETLVEKPDRPRRYQYSAETLTSQIQNQRRSQDSAATLITPPEDPVIYRDPQDRYYSLTVRHTNRPQVALAVAGVPEETSEWVEIPVSSFRKSESSPVPSYLFEKKFDVVGSHAASSQESECSQEQDSPRLPGEVNLALSYPESVTPVETPRARVHRRLSERERVEKFCRKLPELHQLAPGTPKGNSYKQAYLDLTGSAPTNSLWLEWGIEDQNSIVGKEANNLYTKFEEQVDDLRSQYPIGRVEVQSPSRGRGRLRNSVEFPSEGSSQAAKRHFAANRRRRYKGFPPRDWQGSGEGLVGKFSSAQRRFDRPPSIGLYTAPAEEAGEQIAPKRTLSAAKRGVERRRRIAAAPDEEAAFVNESTFDKAVETNNPLEHYLSQNTDSVDCQSVCAEKVDEDLVVNFDCAPSIPKESVKSLANPLRQFSSQVRSRVPSPSYHTR
jgi:hypothetical protein